MKLKTFTRRAAAAGAVLAALMLAALPALAAPKVQVSTTNAVADHADILSDETEQYVNDVSIKLSDACGAQIGVYTLDELLGSTTMEGFAYDVFNAWGLGSDDLDNGVLLLLAQVQVGMRQRHQELVVWRTLGAGKSLLRATLWAEFALLGLVSGLVAAIGAEVALAMLQTKVFDFPWAPDWRLWVLLPLTGAVLLSLCGGGLGLRLLKGKALFRQFSQ